MQRFQQPIRYARVRFLSNSVRRPSSQAYKIYSDLNNSNSFLRKKSQRVALPLDPQDQNIIRNLKNKLANEEHGVGFAAPQFGINKCIIVVAISKEIAKIDISAKESFPLTALINPEIIPLPKYGVEGDWETCFSDRYNTGFVERYRVVKYHAFDEQSKQVSGTAHGLLARILQHECDHLDGIMFKDRASRYLPLEKVFGIKEIDSAAGYQTEDSNLGFQRKI